MSLIKKVNISFVLLTVAFSVGNREVRAQQQNQPSIIASQVREGMAECNRKFPDEVKQAVANTMCEKQAMEPLKRTSPYPDLVDLETTNALVVAEKLQKGKMTLIEAKAAVAQIHSDVVAEFQRRLVPGMAVGRDQAEPEFLGLRQGQRRREQRNGRAGGEEAATRKRHARTPLGFGPI